MATDEREAEKAETPHYDLAVIGSGPAGQKAAITAAQLGKRVVIVDRPQMLGGVSVHTGTIPSKTLREAILYLTGFRERTFYGQEYALKEQISVRDLSFRVRTVVQRETELIRAQLRRAGVTILVGAARFRDPHTLDVDMVNGDTAVSAEYVLIACGTRPAHSPTIPLDGQRTFDSDQLALVPTVPRDLIVVGAGVIGLEYASMFAALGINVTVIDQRATLLDFVDREIVEALAYHMRQRGALFRLGEKVVSVTRNGPRPVTALLESGKSVHGDALLYTVGRQTNADRVNLTAAGLTSDERGRIAVNESYRTAVPHIYAAGDVIGFPALASTSMEQGRLAICDMFGAFCPRTSEYLPYGIYTVPEISTIGQTEEQLTAARIPYEVGIARYEELARAQMIGDATGLLKLLFDPSSLRLLGVHAIGERATEIIHIGQAVLALGATIGYFRDTVFNYPTLAEAYKVAAADGLRKI